MKKTNCGAAMAGIMRFGAGVSLIALSVGLAATPAYAQVTYAEIEGSVQLPDGTSASGADVVVVHTPSGSSVTTRVNAAGRFNATGLRVGGPYTVRVTVAGMTPLEITDLYTDAGDPLSLRLSLQASDTMTLDEIVINGSANALTFGSISTFGSDEIESQATIERRLQEIIQLDSRAFLDFGQPDDDQGVSILGFNTRFNNLVVDGLSQADTFGDNFTGLSTRRSPLSLDAIESLSVETAPFDVQNSGFQGGQINIITKSGENDYHGIFRYQRSGGFLSGTRAGTNPSTGEAVTFAEEDAENTWAATFSGPIIKDKLFFLFNYEEFQETDSLGSCPSDILCNNPSDVITGDIYSQARAISQAQFDFDPGDFNDILNTDNGERKFLLKFDWNVASNHRAQLTLQRSVSDQIDTTRAPGLDSPSTAASFDADVPIGVSAQVFSQWSDDFSTQVQFGFLRQERETRPLAGDTGFGQVFLQELAFALNPDGTLELDEQGNPIPDGDLAIGPDDFDQNNRLQADRYQVKTRGEYNLGNHSLSFGYELDVRDVLRERAPGGNGIFIFEPLTLEDGTQLTTLEAFELGLASSVSVESPFSANLSDAAADFTLFQNSFYVQDSWAVTDKLDLLFGLRYERFDSSDTPTANPFFEARYGFSNTSSLDNRDVWLPRFGFNYTPFERTTFRGGAGIFGGGTPVTWFTEPFLTNGVTFANAAADFDTLGGPVDPNVLPEAIIDQLSVAEGTLVEGLDGDVSFISPDFDIPKSVRLQFAVDQAVDIPYLGKNWNFTAEVTHTEIIDALLFQDIRLVETGEILPTGSPRFIIPTDNPLDTRTGNSLTRANGNAIQDIGIFNTSEGRSTAITLEAQKYWDLKRFGGLNFNMGYTYVESIDVSPANDTDDLDDVFETGAYDNVNNPTPGPSIQAVPHNLVLSLDWRKQWKKDLALNINVFGNFRSGRATSFVIDANDSISSGDLGGIDVTGIELLQPGFSSRANSRLLAYLPTGPDDPLVRYEGGASFDQIQTVIDAFDLSEFQGGFIPRNTIRADDTFRLDVNAQLEVPSPLPGKVVFTAGIRNLLNLIDRDLGVVERFSIRETFYDAAFDTNTGQLVIDDIDTGRPLTEEQFPSTASVWRAQLGVRYEF